MDKLRRIYVKYPEHKVNPDELVRNEHNAHDQCPLCHFP
jgi:hypothetical protein